LLALKDRPQWKTVVGGSSEYIRRMQETWPRVDVKLNARIAGIRRDAEGVELLFYDGHHERYDHVVLATHADQALRLISDPSAEEKKVLGCWKYTHSRTILHSDESVMPPLRRTWSSWNFKRLGGDKTCLTYHMNRLQGLKTKRPYFVSLNLQSDPKNMVCEFDYDHPMFTKEALEQRSALHALNGTGNTWFAGSYFGNGFHEDAVRSGVEVAKGFGIAL